MGLPGDARPVGKDAAGKRRSRRRNAARATDHRQFNEVAIHASEKRDGIFRTRTALVTHV